MEYILISILTIVVFTYIVSIVANKILATPIHMKSLVLCAACAILISLILPRMFIGIAGLGGTFGILIVFAMISSYFIAYYYDNGMRKAVLKDDVVTDFIEFSFAENLEADADNKLTTAFKAEFETNENTEIVADSIETISSDLQDENNSDTPSTKIEIYDNPIELEEKIELITEIDTEEAATLLPETVIEESENLVPETVIEETENLVPETVIEETENLVPETVIEETENLVPETVIEETENLVPETVIEETENLVPETVIEEVENTVPETVIEETENLVPETVIEEVENTVPETVIEEVENTVPETVIEEAENTVPETVIEEAENTVPETVIEEAENTAPETVIEEAENTVPETVIEEAENLVPETVIEETENLVPETVAEDVEILINETIIEEAATLIPEALIEENHPLSTDLDDLVDFAFEQKEQRNFMQALTTFRQALILYPESEVAPFLVVEIGTILKNIGSYNEAIQVFMDGRLLPGISNNITFEQEFINNIAYLRIVKNILVENSLEFMPFNLIPEAAIKQIDSEFSEWRNQS